jgi:ABC-type nitrate/sulfonate/bicarbonate transport system permease component
MTDLRDRYYQKISQGRTSALVEQVRSYAVSQGAVEAEILAAVPQIVDTELRKRLDAAIHEAQGETATKWDLLQSQQAQRLLLYKLIFELRAHVGLAIGLVIGLLIGLLLGYSLWGRSPPATHPQNPTARTIQ